jgi:hypothetical protein
MLPPQAPPSPRGAHRPHHRRPQPLPRAPIAHSPPPPFLPELTDNRPPRAPISRPHSCLCQHHSAPEYSGTVSIPDFPHLSGPSPALPYADRHHHREPTSGEPPPRPTPPIGFPSAPTRTSARPSPAARRRSAGIGRQAAGFGFPCFQRGLKGASGANPLAGPGQVHLWAKSNATVPICIFLSNYSNSILIKVQTSKIVGNCMELIKL